MLNVPELVEKLRMMLSAFGTSCDIAHNDTVYGSYDTCDTDGSIQWFYQKTSSRSQASHMVLLYEL